MTSNNHAERTSPSRRSTLEIEEGVEGDFFLSAEEELNPKPPLLIKVTGYRLLTTSIIAAFGTAKAFKSLDGGSVTATWLDWILGVVLGTTLYWLGLYESVQPPIAVWFFHTDLAQDVFYLLFGVVIASIYCVLVGLSGIFLMQLSVIAWGALPFPEYVEGGRMEPVLSMLFLLSLLILMMPSMVAALLLPFLAGRVIAYVIGLILTLGGRRFKRKTIDFFVRGYQNRFDARPDVYAIMTLPSLVIGVFIVTSFPLEQWLRKLQSMFP